MSSETRRLLGAAAIALVVLWALARLRYPDTPAVTTPVPPLLAQLSAPVRFRDLAEDLAVVAAQVRGSVTVLQLRDGAGSGPRLALRPRPGVAATIVSPSEGATGEAQAVTVDRATGLTLMPTQGTDVTPLAAGWQPDPAPRFLIAATASPEGLVSVHPVLVSTWSRQRSSLWNGDVWIPGSAPKVDPGTLLFTTTGELAGMAVEHGERVAVVSASLLDAAIEAQTRTPPPAEPGWLGLTTTPVTPRLAAAARAEAGVLVLAVDRGSPAESVLVPGDVVTQVNETVISTPEDWSAVVDRTAPGDRLRIQLSDSRQLEVTAGRVPTAARPPLGARLRRVAGGVEIIAVERGTAADDAGLRAGDVITRVDTTDRPRPADLQRAVSSDGDAPLLILFSRGGAPHATVLERR